MKKIFTYFNLNQTEQRGFIILLFSIVVLLIVPHIYNSFTPKETIAYDLVHLEKSRKNGNNKNFRKETTIDNIEENKSYAKNNSEITYFTFNPNTLDESSWKKLGFTDKQVKVIKNYLEKGGRFYKKEDLKKIYSISESDYARIESYIRLENVSLNKDGNKSISTLADEKVRENKFIIDVNSIDTLEWKKLKGIGSILSKRIVKYRNALGGFYAVEQLKEVYGLPEETYESIKDQLKIDPRFKIQKIKINSCTEDELIRHPYFNKKQARTIINYRNQHGTFENYLSLFQIKSLDNVFLHKIENYLEY